jgi:hypothetical protein
MKLLICLLMTIFLLPLCQYHLLRCKERIYQHHRHQHHQHSQPQLYHLMNSKMFSKRTNPYIADFLDNAEQMEEEQLVDAAFEDKAIEAYDNVDEVEDDVPQTGPYNLRERKERSGGFNDTIDSPHDGKSYYPPPTQLAQVDANMKKRFFGFVMTQMTAKAGLRKHGAAAEAALIQEYSQLEDQNVYEAIDPRSLTKEQRKGALQAINLIKEKRDGKLKGRTVADGSVQCELYDKSETTSPTLSTDALVLSIMTDAYERRDVGTADVVGAYLNAYMKDFVIMKFTGESLDILCKVNPEYEKFVVVENGVRVLYVRLIKALYGCVKSALVRMG